MTADDVVAAARAWVGVPFLHQGRSRTAGVDCAGLVICIARELNLVEQDFDITGYRPQPNGTMQPLCREHLVEDTPRPGNIFVMRFDTDPQHMGFFVPYRHGGLGVIHAIAARKRVVEHRLDAIWSKRIVASYRFPGVA